MFLIIGALHLVHKNIHTYVGYKVGEQLWRYIKQNVVFNFIHDSQWYDLQALADMNMIGHVLPSGHINGVYKYPWALIIFHQTFYPPQDNYYFLKPRHFWSPAKSVQRGSNVLYGHKYVHMYLEAAVSCLIWTISVLNQGRSALNLGFKDILYKAVLSLYDHGAQLWSTSSSSNVSKLQKAQWKLLRIIKISIREEIKIYLPTTCCNFQRNSTRLQEIYCLLRFMAKENPNVRFCSLSFSPLPIAITTNCSPRSRFNACCLIF